jgi:methylenetetrahydrofolate dehydrogenase (NADP+)/methenyltetrahydrofolate cyclohydrolase
MPWLIGRSNLVGKPMAQLLLRENCHRDASRIPARKRPRRVWCASADIVVAAVGRPD